MVKGGSSLEQARTQIRLTGKQFFVLTGIAGAKAVVGLEDPFRGTLAEEMPAEVARIEQELEEAGYIRLVDGEPELVPQLLEYIEICSRALLTIHLAVDDKQRSRSSECFFYYSAGAVVKAELKYIDHMHMYELEEIGTPAEAWMKIMSSLNLQERPKRCPEQLKLPKGKLWQWLNGEQEASGAAQSLRKEGSSEQAVTRLAEAVKAPENYSAFTAYYRLQHDWRVEGIELLRGREANWVVRPDDRHDQIREASVMEIVRELGDVISRIK